MTDRDQPEPPDDSQQFDDPSPIRDDEQPAREHEPTEAELAVEAAAAPTGDIASDAALTDREAAANDAAESRRRFERRDAARWSARGLAGLAAIALASAAVLGATALPEDLRAESLPPSTHVQPASPMQSRVCAGSVLRVGTADGQDALALDALQEPEVAIGSLGGDVAESPLAMRQAELPGGASIVQRGEASTFSAAQSVSVDDEAARGLAASECAETRLEQWLVGGSTRTGRQTTLTIANASEVAASVDITVYGPDGPVESIGSTGVTVRAGTVEVLDLAAIAPGIADAVVHVASAGAPVTAHLQQTTTRGLERGGFDVIDPVSALTGAVLPGVVIAEPSGLETQPDYDDTIPVLRLLSPTGGTVRVIFQSADGSTIASEGQLEAGRVTDFPLDDLPTGVLAVRIEADAPVVAGARSVAIAGEGLDFDWVAGGQPRSGTSSIAVPNGPGARLHIVSTSDADQEITIGGEPVALPAMGVLEREVGGGAIEITGESLVVGVGYRSDSLIAGFTASPQGPGAQGITVLH